MVVAKKGIKIQLCYVDPNGGILEDTQNKPEADPSLLTAVA